ncbi:hypothetical protein Q5752_003447 [Cryptotrichosporon argae]
MAKFINWIQSPAGRQYFFSTHFWGPVANWGLPLAAVTDVLTRDEEVISGVMSPTLAAYSAMFMRFAWRVQPRNYLLFACHATNATAQTVQVGRFINYWYMGGRERKHPVAAKLDGAKGAVEGVVEGAVDSAKKAVGA